MQIYTFLEQCNRSELPKEILDCGAGGPNPPLRLFAQQGYKTMGIEIDPQQLDLANDFASKNSLQLDIVLGDMVELPYANESVSHVMCHNTIFHLSKLDIARAIGEIRRVMRPGGLFYVNFIPTDDPGFGEGEQVSDGEYLQTTHHGQVLNTYHGYDEPEQYFQGFALKFRENRQRSVYRPSETISWHFIDYILQKQ